MNELKKKWSIQTHWSKVLAMHTDWLISKGYTERMLESGEPDGRLKERIKEGITQAVQNTIWIYRLEEFDVETVGRFKEKEDTVVFRFSYQLDPAGGRLWLTSIKANLDATSLEYLIERNTPGQLPAASTVHKQLLAIQQNALLSRLYRETQQPPGEPVKKKKM
ncbi:MAG TPA: hypothetical protein VHE34_21135 [Puia sp.]|uniref:hypothetical protein n=1 Tax=Puia sp. TaxID=2045100 RepID=UPI002BDDB7F2|nr:hypothetical protein [Puia sp.]HVU97748.1 hypothetical protein [Puia sp.]